MRTNSRLSRPWFVERIQSKFGGEKNPGKLLRVEVIIRQAKNYGQRWSPGEGGSVWGDMKRG